MSNNGYNLGSPMSVVRRFYKNKEKEQRQKEIEIKNKEQQCQIDNIVSALKNLSITIERKEDDKITISFK